MEIEVEEGKGGWNSEEQVMTSVKVVWRAGQASAPSLQLLLLAHSSRRRGNGSYEVVKG